MKLTGIFASIPTPFDHRGDLYTAKIRHNVGRWNRTSLSGYLVCAAAGEGALLTSEEKVRVWEQVAATAKSGAILLAATGAESVRETVQLCDRAAEIGYTAAVVAPPRCATVAGRRSETHRVYYQAVADAVRLPVIVENVAPGADNCLSLETLQLLARHPNIAGVCHGSGAAGVYGNSVDSESGEFQVLAGDACVLASSLEAGALGAILDFASAAPFLCLSLEEAVRTRQLAAAEDLQKLITSAAGALSSQYGIAGLKYALDIQGYYGGPPRLPGLPINPDERKHIEDLFREITS